MSTQEKYIRRTSQNGKIDKIDDGDFFVHLKIRIHHFYIIYLHKIMTIENDRHLRMAIALYPRLDFWLIELCIIDVLSAVFITLTISFFFFAWLNNSETAVRMLCDVRERNHVFVGFTLFKHRWQDFLFVNTISSLFLLQSNALNIQWWQATRQACGIRMSRLVCRAYRKFSS